MLTVGLPDPWAAPSQGLSSRKEGTSEGLSLEDRGLLNRWTFTWGLLITLAKMFLKLLSGLSPLQSFSFPSPAPVTSAPGSEYYSRLPSLIPFIFPSKLPDQSQNQRVENYLCFILKPWQVWRYVMLLQKSEMWEPTAQFTTVTKCKIIYEDAM